MFLKSVPEYLRAEHETRLRPYSRVR
jgi:hypothetical protein